MAVREILKMGDKRLLRHAQPVKEFDTDALHLLISDLIDTMRAANGAGLAAPQIGVDLQVVIFGSGASNPRYPDRPVVPQTVLINPVIIPIETAMESDWEGCLSVPGLRGVVPRFGHIRYTGFNQYGDPIEFCFTQLSFSMEITEVVNSSLYNTIRDSLAVQYL